MEIRDPERIMIVVRPQRPITPEDVVETAAILAASEKEKAAMNEATSPQDES